MKILLLGELSGLHKELRAGFDTLGTHDVVSAAMINRHDVHQDINFYHSSRTGKWGAVEEILDQLRKFGKLKGYDIVQIISPKFFDWHLHKPLMNRIYKGNNATVMVNTGCSNDYNTIVKELKYSPCSGCKKYDKQGGICTYERTEEKQLERDIYAKADRIVSTCYEYALAMHHAGFAFKNMNIALPVAFNRSQVPLISFTSNRPIEIFYGETRYGYKGGRYILDALEQIEQTFPKQLVHITRANRLPFKEYQQLLHRSDIVIDQCNSYTYGMNAVYAMALGKVVLSGKEPESLNGFDIPIEACPIINIRPDSKMIFEVLSNLIVDRKRIIALSVQGIDFIEKYHESSVIARQYIAMYETILQQKTCEI